MADELTAADVERIAALAQLELTEEEAARFTRELADILAYARQVQALDTGGVPATSHVRPVAADRADEPRDSLSVEDVLGNAPDPAPQAGMFKVPRVLGD
jgi:aspartyl-tRNA(Asn)/glutamyl-tRNA(Gln) amidotransferase subunit C